MATPSEDYRTIPLTRGQVAIVDAADYDWMSQWKWRALYDPSNGNWYAVRTSSRKIKPRIVYRMHREILGLPPGGRLIVGDHIDPNRTLDNRRSNLRIATASENAMNRRKHRPGLKGTSFHIRRGDWIAMIGVGGKRTFLGYFPIAEEAHRAYSEASKRIHGEFSRTA